MNWSFVKTVGVEKKLVDKLVEHSSAKECTENIDEAKMVKITSMELHSIEFYSTKNMDKCTVHCIVFNNVYNQHWNCYLFYLRQIHESKSKNCFKI